MRYTIYSMVLDKNKFISQFSRIGIYVIFFWIIFLLVRSVWQNWSLRQSIHQLNEQIAILEQNKNDLNNLIVYYRSDSFKELEARKKLGMKKPDEKMVILPVSSSNPTSSAVAGESVSSPNNFPDEVKKEQESFNFKKENSSNSNWYLWWRYFTE